jgi:hypothetical protein
MRFALGAVPRLAQLTGDAAMSRMTAALCEPDEDGSVPGALELLTRGPDELPPATVVPPVFEILPVTGMLCSCRPTPEGLVRVQCVGSKPDAGHGHEDKGSIVLEAYGEEILIDRGTCFYGDARSSLMKHAWRHNLMTPDDDEGHPCHQENPVCRPVIPGGDGDERTLHAAIDTTAAWRGLLAHAARRIDSPRPTALTLTDVAQRVTGGTVSVHFQSRFPWVAKDGSWKTTGQRACVTVSPGWDVAAAETEQDLFDSRYAPVYRLTLRSAPGQRFELVTRLKVGPSAPPAGTGCDAAGDAIRLRRAR